MNSAFAKLNEMLDEFRGSRPPLREHVGSDRRSPSAGPSDIARLNPIAKVSDTAPQGPDAGPQSPDADELKKSFHSWYAKQMQQQLKTVPLVNVKVDVTAGVVKNNSMNWFIHAWHALQAQPSIIINGFKKSGIYDAVAEVI